MTGTSDNRMVQYQENMVDELEHPISGCSVCAASVSKHVVWHCHDERLRPCDLTKSDASV